MDYVIERRLEQLEKKTSGSGFSGCLWTFVLLVCLLLSLLNLDERLDRLEQKAGLPDRSWYDTAYELFGKRHERKQQQKSSVSP